MFHNRQHVKYIVDSGVIDILSALCASTALYRHLVVMSAHDNVMSLNRLGELAEGVC